VRLARAHSQESTLSERRYKKLKRILLSWPLGRALIYTPLTIMAKIHPIHPGNKFSVAVNAIKHDLIPRHEASKILKAGNSQEAESASTTSSTRTLKRHHSPDPTPNSKEPRVDEFMAQQNNLLEKLCQLVKSTNENVNMMLNRGTSIPADSQSSAASIPLHYNNEDAQECYVDESIEDSWCPPPLVTDESENMIDEESTMEPLEDFAPGTKETEGKITKADEILVKQGRECQRFNSES
jgi:hypothetical protein